MDALVFTAPGEVRFLSVADPQPGDDECLVHVMSSGICGSELHGVRDPGFRQPPLIMGHEFAGVTDSGAAVIVNPMLSCGHCDQCARGSRQLCPERAIIGIHRPGGFAARVAVPRSALVDKPAALGWDAAAMVEPAAGAVHAWRLGGASPGTRIAILGCGAIGLMCLVAARSAGAADVHMTDLSPARLAVARSLGASSTGTVLDGEYDLIIDAAGTTMTHALSVRHQRPGGTAVWIGLAQPDPGFDALALVRGEKKVIGSFAYKDEDFADAVALLQHADLGWASAYPLADGARVFTRLMNGELEPVKALLHPGAATI
jgi:threonine dehydrogenase-like Zn-dependent dehydrogenase